MASAYYCFMSAFTSVCFLQDSSFSNCLHLPAHEAVSLKIYRLTVIREERNFGVFLILLLGCGYCREEVSLFMGTWELELVWIFHGIFSTGGTAAWCRLSLELASMNHSCLHCNTVRVTGLQVISKIFIRKHWFTLWTLWCGIQPSFSLYITSAFIFIRGSPVKHFSLRPCTSKWMRNVKS